MTRINLDFFTIITKKIAKIATETSENTHIHNSISTYTHTHNSTAQHNSNTHRAQHTTAHSTATKATAWASVVIGEHSVWVKEPDQPFEPLL